MNKRTKRRIEDLELQVDHFEIKAIQAERNLNLCLGWIAAQHNLHPLAPEVVKPGSEFAWGNSLPRDL